MYAMLVQHQYNTFFFVSLDWNYIKYFQFSFAPHWHRHTDIHFNIQIDEIQLFLDQCYKNCKLYKFLSFYFAIITAVDATVSFFFLNFLFSWYGQSPKIMMNNILGSDKCLNSMAKKNTCYYFRMVKNKRMKKEQEKD